MTRQIKFRTWDTHHKEFAEWTNRDPFFSTSHGQIFFWERTQKEDGSYDGDIVIQDFGDRFVLQQFTGLQDSTGKDIYEGDILRFYKGKSYQTEYKVYWDKCGFSLISAKGKGDDYGVFTKALDRLVPADDPTVIGNIFENPELI